MSLSSWYQDWHNNPNHKVIHWFAFGLASIALIVFTRQDLSSFSKSLDELNPFHINMAEAMTVTVASDRVNIGTEFIPRRNDLASKLIVPAGQTVTLPASASYDYIEVAGTLVISGSSNTNLNYTTMLILPGGTFSGTVPCGITANLTGRDVPIDTAKDPYQWGNGIVNLGTERLIGCQKTSFINANGSIPAGATSITLSSVPQNWQAGDLLFIPDTAAPSIARPVSGGNEYLSRQESPVSIASISGSTITLSKPLDFEHNVITGLNNLAPRVMNLTRNITIKSQNQNGTRTHTVTLGDNSLADEEYYACVDCGRTLSVTLDSTTADANGNITHVGTNQVGRYATHFHHMDSAPSSKVIGLAIIGNQQTTKWGLAIHSTSDMLIQDNIVVDFPGAGIATEDGNEVRNIFRHNIVAYTGSGDSGQDLGFFPGQVFVNNNCPGCEGSGFWFRGVMNIFDANEAWNNIRGITLFNQQLPATVDLYPSQVGGALDTATYTPSAVPVSMTNNVTIANTTNGYENWAVPRFPLDGLISGNNLGFQAGDIQTDHVGNWFRNPEIWCPSNGLGIASGRAYTSNFQLEGGFVKNCSLGIHGGGGIAYELVSNTTLQNAVDIDLLSTSTNIFDHVNFVPLGNNPPQYIFMEDGQGRLFGTADYTWRDPVNNPPGGGQSELPGRGSRIKLISYQGDSKTYLLYYNEQLDSLPAWHSLPVPAGLYNPPESGLTWGQAWAKYGLAYEGDVISAADAITLPGIIHGYAKLGTIINWAPPRAVITYPKNGEAVSGPGEGDPIKNSPLITGYARFEGAITGDPYGAANEKFCFSIDGNTAVDWGSSGAQPLLVDDRSFNTAQDVTVGSHQIQTWRTTSDCNSKIVNSGFITNYVILAPNSTSPEPLPGPPPSPTPGGTPIPAPVPSPSPTPGPFLLPGQSPTPPPPPVTPPPVTPPPVTPPPVTPPPVTPPPVTPPPVTPPPPTSTTYDRTITINQFDGRPLTKTITGTVSVLNSSKVLIKSYPFTSTSDGSITVTIDVSPIVGFISIKAAPFLQKIVSIDLNVTAPSVVPKLFIGDVNQDNIVNSIDFSAMNAKWFMTDTATDLNQDGLVNTLDYSLMNKNWFVQGDR